MQVLYFPAGTDMKKVRKELNARSKRAFARSLPPPPLPYETMVNDITGCIHAGAAYLAALGLVCYIEICGRRIIFNDNKKVRYWRCFSEFLDKYMGLGPLLNLKLTFEGKRVSFKDAVRNGLVHRFFMQVDSSGIFLTADNDPDSKKYGFFISKPGHLEIIVVPLFQLFCDGLKKAQKQGDLK